MSYVCTTQLTNDYDPFRIGSESVLSRVYMYTYIHIYPYTLSVYVYKYTYIYIYIYICMYIYIYIGMEEYVICMYDPRVARL